MPARFTRRNGQDGEFCERAAESVSRKYKVVDLGQFLAQQTPWGLTVAQTGGIGVVAVILFAGWLVVHLVMRLSGFLFRLGCAAILVFLCGVVSYVVLYNLTTR